MTPESFSLDGDTPTVRVAGSCSKNRKEAVQPIPSEVARALRDYLRDKPAGKPVWPGQWRRKAVFMVRADLEEARRQWLSDFQDARRREEAERSDFLAYVDSQGRYADFHSLRHGYCTMVGKLGVSPKEHQDLARHSSYALTSRYSHSRLYDLAAAVEGLPIPMTPDREALRATGTDGDPSKILGPNLGPQVAKTGDFLRFPETIDDGMSQRQNPGKQAVLAAFQGPVDSPIQVEVRGFEPLTF